jgi:hypothetical protein
MNKIATIDVNFSALQTRLFPSLMSTGRCFLPSIPPQDDHSEFLKEGFIVVEVLDIDLKKIGVLLWDNAKEIMYGPYVVKPEEVRVQMVALPSNSQDIENCISKSGYLVLDDYKITGLPNGQKEIYCYFSGQGGLQTIDYCVSDFDKETQVFEEC